MVTARSLSFAETMSEARPASGVRFAPIRIRARPFPIFTHRSPHSPQLFGLWASPRMVSRSAGISTVMGCGGGVTVGVLVGRPVSVGVGVAVIVGVIVGVLVGVLVGVGVGRAPT